MKRPVSGPRDRRPVAVAAKWERGGLSADPNHLRDHAGETEPEGQKNELRQNQCIVGHDERSSCSPTGLVDPASASVRAALPILTGRRNARRSAAERGKQLESKWLC